jgi:thymidine phosphorylase
VWGGAVQLSPADDVIISVERPLDLDSNDQMVASILSKKLAAGSTHVVLDVPVGPSAKVRSAEAADALEHLLCAVGAAIGLHVRVARTDGRQPVGRGVGPALEARDVLSVLRRDPTAPADLRDRALSLAGEVIELAGAAPSGTGKAIAQRLLESGAALTKFEAICQAQGGMREPARARHVHVVDATRAGVVAAFDNRRLARIAKLAGAPRAPTAGLELHAPLGTKLAPGDPLLTIHAETPGELDYARAYLRANPQIISLDGAG